MEYTTVIALVSGLLGSLVTSLSQYFIARLSAKSRNDKAAELSEKYLKLADMTADQLEERINRIGQLDNRIRELTNQNGNQTHEIEELQAKRAERDEQIEALQSSVAALQVQVDRDARERNDLRQKLSAFEVNNRVLWKYVYALLEHMRRHKIKPPEPPEELRSDPEIMKLINNGEAE